MVATRASPGPSNWAILGDRAVGAGDGEQGRRGCPLQQAYQRPGIGHVLLYGSEARVVVEQDHVRSGVQGSVAGPQ
ncbi:hypothetical protein ACQPZG_00425 (plasmid) [Streptomyces sp. CA-294286]|uniref:hypothetical protein n=1 Tax=Streptomyces sp. CA-294286 TaxID=3240070 RepID=UPI003D8B02DC